MDEINSRSDIPSQFFLDTLRKIGRIGWHMTVSGVSSDLDIAPAIVFHTHPDDADFFYMIIQFGVEKYDGETDWIINRGNNSNRFILYPKIPVELEANSERIRHIDYFRTMKETNPNLGRAANNDLISLADFIYKSLLQ